MIGHRDLHTTAANPNFEMGTLYVRQDSAANVALLDVPRRSGIAITRVWMHVTNCDGVTADYDAVRTGTMWVADVPGTHFATPGEVPDGVEVWASGDGADGEPYAWSIGTGSLCVREGDSGTPMPGVAWTAIKLRETAPTNPAYGDAKIEGGALYVWDGSQWVGGGGGGGGIVDDAVTPASANPVKSSGVWSAVWGALAALPVGFASLYDWCASQLALKANASAVPTASTSNPVMDGAASAGTPGTYACENHRHPTDTSRAAASEVTALAQTVADKADAADLRYSKRQCVVAANPLPDAFFPITFTYNGVPYTASSNADLTYYGDASSYYVHYNLPGGGDVALAYVADGVWEFGAMDDLAVNGCPVGEGVVVPLLDRAEQSLDAGVYTASGSATVWLVPPPAVAGRVRDILLDVDNSSGLYSADFEFAGLDAAYLLAVADGEDHADLTTIEAGARARLYITETAQTATPTGGTSAVPVISLRRLTITVGGAA